MSKWVQTGILLFYFFSFLKIIFFFQKWLLFPLKKKLLKDLRLPSWPQFWPPARQETNFFRGGLSWPLDRPQTKPNFHRNSINTMDKENFPSLPLFSSFPLAFSVVVCVVCVERMLG